MRFFFCKQKTADELRIRYLSSDVCSSDLETHTAALQLHQDFGGLQPSLRLLHHSFIARRSRQPPTRCDLARSRKARCGRNEGTAGHQPGHVGLWRRYQASAARMEQAAGTCAYDRPCARIGKTGRVGRTEEHPTELQSLTRI